MSPIQPNASPREHDLALLAAGHETGWWDDHGRPAPWPADYWLADGMINPQWQESGANPEEESEPDTTDGDQDF